ncbi:MAG: DUF4260 family protein, partial [Methylocystis sp.]
LLLQRALLPLALIGFDRALGYGLKSGTAFRDTHLGRVGGGASSAPRREDASLSLSRFRL